jgi:hypothetical protein
MRRATAATLLGVVAMCATAFAGETGSISGVVRDSQGGVLPGVLVKVSGPQMPAGRDANTTGSGSYAFDNLIPGEYKVEASLAGMGSAARQVRVFVDVDAQVDLALSPTLAEEVTVSAEAPAVDLKSTEVNINFTDEQIAQIPLERSYKGLFQLVPGVAENRSSVGPSGGGSRQDNTYLIDGVNITNPGFGYLSTEVNQLDIAEFNIKRGAITAEFGRSAGFVTNAVSRSGTNEIHGTARFDWMPQSFIADFEENAFRDPLLTTVVNPAIGVGGPFIKDKLFWYGSARYYEEVKGADRTNQVGGSLPDEERTGHELFGKITATPSEKHLIVASLRDRPNDVENANLTSTTDASRATTDENGSRVATASWSFFPTSQSTVEVKYLYLEERNEATPVTDLGYLPAPFDASDPASMGQYTDPTQSNLLTGGYEFNQRVNYKRHEVRAVFGQFLDIGSTRHQIKAGVGYEFGEEELFRLANGWGQISRITVSGQPRLRARYYFEQPPQLGQGRTWSLFLQDTISIGRRLALNLGVLANRDEFAQDLEGSGGCPLNAEGELINTIDGVPGGAAVFETNGDRCTFLRFGFGDEIQPRLGVNFNVRPGKGDKVYANWGRYYNMDQKSSGRSLAPRRIFQREAQYTLDGTLISDLPRASTTGKFIDHDLKPTYNDEWLAGYATPFLDDWSADVYFIYRNTENFIEDVPSVLPDTGPYAAANLPCETFASCQNANAERTYKSFTLEVARRMAKRWSMNASYTWSRLEGNFDLDYAIVSVFNTSSFIQDGPGDFVEEPNRFGPLREDRPHLFKLFVNVEPISHLTVGGYLRVQSGSPWNARGADTQSSAALNNLEPPGSHRNPTWTNFDLLANYRFRLSDRVSLMLEGRLLNAFNSQTQLSTDARQFLVVNRIPTPPYIGPYPESGLNPLFGTGDGFAPPRRLILSAQLAF